MWPRIALGAIGVLVMRVGAKFFTRLWCVLRQLWHEVMGCLFIAIAAAGASTAVREWKAGRTRGVALAAAFTLMFAYFGITSFLHARRVRQQAASQQP